MDTRLRANQFPFLIDFKKAKEKSLERDLRRVNLFPFLIDFKKAKVF